MQLILLRPFIIQNPRTILQVVADPDIAGRRAKAVFPFVGAVHIACQGVVEIGAFDDDFEGDVVEPVQDQYLDPTVRNITWGWGVEGKELTIPDRTYQPRSSQQISACGLGSMFL